MVEVAEMFVDGGGCRRPRRIAEVAFGFIELAQFEIDPSKTIEKEALPGSSRTAR